MIVDDHPFNSRLRALELGVLAGTVIPVMSDAGGYASVTFIPLEQYTGQKRHTIEQACRVLKEARMKNNAELN